VSDLKPDRQRRDLHKSNLSVTSRKIGPVYITYVASLVLLGRIARKKETIDAHSAPYLWTSLATPPLPPPPVNASSFALSTSSFQPPLPTWPKAWPLSHTALARTSGALAVQHNPMVGWPLSRIAHCMPSPHSALLLLPSDPLRGERSDGGGATKPTAGAVGGHVSSPRY
jgi:hypothetical protein